MRLVQMQRGIDRVVAIVEEPNLRLVKGVRSVYSLVLDALSQSVSLGTLASARAGADRVEYDPIHAGASDWRLLPPLDHPDEPARCLVSGTGLTHRGSANERNAMHAGQTPLTDSMKMFRAGLEGGRPAGGAIGVAPEWFYKGCATVLRAHGEPLEVPAFASDGGEEAELAGLYVIDPAGRPCRVGMAAGNEFSDHRFERTNYLNLAGSKLRTCAIGPELVVNPDFQSVRGRAAIERKETVIWTQPIATGEDAMCHSLANLEHHHFKFDGHRRPGDVHVHFFGADRLSVADDVMIESEDVIEIQFEGYGRPLRNPVRVAPGPVERVKVQPLV